MKKLVITAAVLLTLAFIATGCGFNGYGMGGMMGGGAAEQQTSRQLNYANVAQLLEQTADTAQVDTAKNQVTFTGHKMEIAVAAVQPGSPDTTFEVASLVNPTIVVPADAQITLDLMNMDYGDQMDHGIVITSETPPYPVLSMMGMPNTLTGTPILPPRQSANARSSLYAESSITFQAPAPGTYYYLCQYYDHASEGMYGRFIVAQSSD